MLYRNLIISSLFGVIFLASQGEAALLDLFNDLTKVDRPDYLLFKNFSDPNGKDIGRFEVINGAPDYSTGPMDVKPYPIKTLAQVWNYAPSRATNYTEKPYVFAVKLRWAKVYGMNDNNWLVVGDPYIVISQFFLAQKNGAPNLTPLHEYLKEKAPIIFNDHDDLIKKFEGKKSYWDYSKQVSVFRNSLLGHEDSTAEVRKDIISIATKAYKISNTNLDIDNNIFTNIHNTLSNLFAPLYNSNDQYLLSEYRAKTKAEIQGMKDALVQMVTRDLLNDKKIAEWADQRDKKRSENVRSFLKEWWEETQLWLTLIDKEIYIKKGWFGKEKVGATFIGEPQNPQVKQEINIIVQNIKALREKRAKAAG